MMVASAFWLYLRWSTLAQLPRMGERGSRRDYRVCEGCTLRLSINVRSIRPEKALTRNPRFIEERLIASFRIV
jgi:hypothetical protein